ncbi:MAG: radical SAM protein [Candidatus Altiarchaeota archaeon]|nr:radical SAM protein [Candidatus Altiarchaeota archaeon]
MTAYRHLFGPVPSRRLRSSLGVDIVPYKVCSLDCIYCQLGRTTEKTLERKEYVPVKEVFPEIREFLAAGGKCDYITLSGSGEPTLNSAMGEVIKEIKKLTEIPVAVLTNSTLMTNEAVRRELSFADLIVPSLDAATQGVFEEINRPAPGIRVEDIIDGLVEFKKTYKAGMWLEVMLVSGINDSQTELDEIRKAIKLIGPDRVQLNTVIRPPAEKYAKPLSPERMEEIAGFLNAEVIAEFDRHRVSAYSGDVEEQITELLKRRPCTVSDISSALGLHVNEVLKYIETLEKDDVIESKRMDGKEYYTFKK